MKIATFRISGMLERMRRHNRLMRTMVPVLLVLGLVGWILFWIGSETVDLTVHNRIGNMAAMAGLVFRRGTRGH
jgi:hypothetical protein